MDTKLTLTRSITLENNMQEWERADRRKSVRFPVVLSLRCNNLNATVEFSSHTHDISKCGIGLVATEELLPGTPVDVCLSMPDNGEKIKTKGTVMWQQSLGPHRLRIGINLEQPEIKPIPIVLRAMQAQTT